MSIHRYNCPATDRSWLPLAKIKGLALRRGLAKRLPWSRMTSAQKQDAMRIVRHGLRGIDTQNTAPDVLPELP